MSKIIAIIVLAIVGITGFSGCGGSSAPTAPVVTVTASPSNDTDSAFLSVVRAEYPVLNNVDDSTIIAYAHSVCTMFDNGATLNDVIENAAGAGFSNSEMGMMGYITGAGVAAYCPQYAGMFESSSYISS